MTRQAYPTASSDVIEALALDGFIDALNESEIRLRLREVGPKTVSEAEKVAVRMEAHRIADRNRSRLVGNCEGQGINNTQNDLASTVSKLTTKVDKLLANQRTENDSEQRNNIHRNPVPIQQNYHSNRRHNFHDNKPRYHKQTQNSNTFGAEKHAQAWRERPFQHNTQNRQHNAPHHFREQGNERMSNEWGHVSTNQWGPRLH